MVGRRVAPTTEGLLVGLRLHNRWRLQTRTTRLWLLRILSIRGVKRETPRPSSGKPPFPTGAFLRFKAMFGHPLVVERFGEITATGVRQQDDHEAILVFLGNLEGCVNRHAS